MQAQTTSLLTLAAVKTAIDARLNALFTAQEAVASQIDPLQAKLLAELRTFIARGGKRLRPYLAYLGYAGHGGAQPEAMLDVAVSQELLHNFMLIHDDIIDRDLTRYGGHNISGRYAELTNSRHLGDAIALLGGDINHTLAIDAIVRSQFSDAQKLAAIACLNRTTLEVVGGELIDVFLPHLKTEEVTRELLTKMMRYKTASYSFEGPLQIGAVLAGASPAATAKLSAFAIPAGIAFQLQDDLLGMFGDEALTGKPVVSDLREGKHTLLIHVGLEMAAPEDQTTIRKALGNSEVTNSDLKEVQDILTRSGAKAKIESLAADYATQAAAALQQTELNETVKNALADLTGALTIRRK